MRLVRRRCPLKGADRLLQVGDAGLQLWLPRLDGFHLGAEVANRPLDVAAELTHKLAHELFCLVVHGEPLLLLPPRLDDRAKNRGQIRGGSGGKWL